MKILTDEEKTNLINKLDNIDLSNYNEKEKSMYDLYIDLIRKIIYDLSITEHSYKDYMISQKVKLYCKNRLKELNKYKTLNNKECNDIINFLNSKLDVISFDLENESIFKK